jgi:glycosyltransferase involved in cell wall biosynthesis
VEGKKTMKRKRVCVDVNAVVPLVSRGFLTGVGRTVLELVRAIDRVKNELPFEVLLYMQNIRGVTPSDFGVTLPYRNLFLPVRDYIDRFISPFYVRTLLTGGDLWHCPHNVGQVDDVSRTIFTVHDMIAIRCRGEFADGGAELKKKYPLLLQQSRAVITCSHSSGHDIAELMGVDPQKIHVIHWGVDRELFKPLADRDDVRKYLAERYGLQTPYFFSVSCGYGRKNTLQLLEAYVRLLRNNPCHDLVVVWSGYGQDVARLVEEAQGRVHVLDNLSDCDLVRLYNGATAMFFPSSYEGFGLPVLEAMACGVPVVTCDNSSLKEIGGDAALYVPSPDATDLEREMERFENRRYDPAELSRRGVNRAALFTWEKCAAETLAVYETYL